METNSSMAPMALKDETIYYTSREMRRTSYAVSFYSKSSYLINQYIPSMQIVRNIINYDNYIKVHNNPRYYFIKSLEDLHNNNKDDANDYLLKFITFSDDYISASQKEKMELFTQGCNTDDIDWIFEYKTSKEYKISLLLRKYLNNKISDKILIKEINKLDSNPKIFDLYDNIILTIMIIVGTILGKLFCRRKISGT